MTALVSASSEHRIEALKRKHAILKLKIEEERRFPSSADYDLRQLKKQKLVIKEEIEGLKRISANN